MRNLTPEEKAGVSQIQKVSVQMKVNCFDLMRHKLERGLLEPEDCIKILAETIDKLRELNEEFQRSYPGI